MRSSLTARQNLKRKQIKNISFAQKQSHHSSTYKNNKNQFISRLVGTQTQYLSPQHSFKKQSDSKSFNHKDSYISSTILTSNQYHLSKNIGQEHNKMLASDIYKIIKNSNNLKKPKWHIKSVQNSRKEQSMFIKIPLGASQNFQDSKLMKQKSNNILRNNQVYKKFDITTLDFSFSRKENNFQQKQNVNIKCEYQSIVSKSRSNIKKILELNNLVKHHKMKERINEELNSDKIQQNIELLSKLKTGCFGTIYQARLRDNGKLVAIKCIAYDRKHHQRQTQICRIIQNPFVVKILKVYIGVQFKPLQKFETNIRQSIKVNQQKEPKQKSPLRTKKAVQSSKKTLSNNQNQDNVKPNLQKSMQEINLDLNQTIKKNNIIENNKSAEKNDNKKQTSVSLIVMDNYECDLNEYIQMKSTIDNLSIKMFCYQMLRAVLYIHSNQICHRDIKPHNFLIKKHKLVIADFGSAKLMKNHKMSNVAYICSRYYRAPQLILGYKFYDKSIDIWSLGCVMAQLALGKPIFRGASSMDQLIKIIHILGQPNWRKVSFMVSNIPKIPSFTPKGLKRVFNPQTSTLFIDLLENMLVFNSLHRITAGQALSHAYFDQLRDQLNFNQICKQMDISNFFNFERCELKHNQHLRNKLVPLWANNSDKNEYNKGKSIKKMI